MHMDKQIENESLSENLPDGTDIEHLVMVGGRNDLLIESNIMRRGRAEARTPAYARMEGAAATHTRATCGAALEEPPA